MNDVKDFKRLLDEIRWLGADLAGQDFLATRDKTLKQLRQVLYTAEAMKWLYIDNISARCFDTGLAVLQIMRTMETIRSPEESLADRFSFISAANLLGLTVQSVPAPPAPRETADMISFLPLTAVIGIRGSLHPGAGDAYMREVGTILDREFERGAAAVRPGIVNLQCHQDHPARAMADLLVLKQRTGSLEKLAGKKIAITWAYPAGRGDALSVVHGMIGLTTRFGMDVYLAHPQEYDPDPAVTAAAAKNAAESGGGFHTVHSPAEVPGDADIVYAAAWDPYEIIEKRAALDRENDRSGLEELDRQCRARNAGFKNWPPGRERIGEISRVSFQSFVIAAMILNQRFREPAVLLSGLRKRNIKRMHEV